jgi:hypothetical protein
MSTGATEYPVMKTATAIGSVLNFNKGEATYEVIACDGICYSFKGFLLNCLCTSNKTNPKMVGEMYDFDDRIFRTYNNNNVVVVPPVKDQRLNLVLSSLGYDEEKEICQEDYDKVEDSFIMSASEALQSDDELEKLAAAGFGDLVEKLKNLQDASDAYDWTRENL